MRSAAGENKHHHETRRAGLCFESHQLSQSGPSIFRKQNGASLSAQAFPVDRPDAAPTIRSFMHPVRYLRAVLLLCVLVFCTSCAEFEAEMNARTKALADSVKTATGGHPNDGYWHGDDASGSPKIVVNLTEQRARFYKGKTIVGESTISSGKKAFETPPGHYSVIQKDEHHVSSEFGDYVSDSGDVVKANVDVRKDSRPPGSHFAGAKMPYFMRFRGGYGMHAGYVPRFRASHGCIRMPIGMVKHFFNAAEEGTPVLVRE